MSNPNEEVTEKHFPHLTSAEREEVVRLYAAWSSQSKDYDSLSFTFVTTLETWMLQYFHWETPPDKKMILRKKLLNVAGLWKIIRSEEIHALLNRVAPYNKKPLTDVKINDPYREYLEIASFDIKYMDEIAAVLASILRDDRVTYLDFVAGSRELNMHPASSLIVFKKHLNDEVVFEGYLSASAEILTKTVLVDPFNPDGTARDAVMIAFDLVFESALIDGFHHIFEQLDQDHLLFKAKSESCNFLLKFLAHHEERLIAQGRKNFVTYLKNEVLNPQILQIAELTKKLKKNPPPPPSDPSEGEDEE